jgi:hypothetical protein
VGSLREIANGITGRGIWGRGLVGDAHGARPPIWKIGMQTAQVRASSEAPNGCGSGKPDPYEIKTLEAKAHRSHVRP